MKFNRVAAAAAGATLCVGALVSGATPAGATTGDDVGVQSCYGSAKSFNKLAGGFDFPQGIYFIATSNCSDINIKTNGNTFVRVCFLGKECQKKFKKASAGKWTVVATNVKDGANYRFQFYNDAPVSGVYAA